MYADTNPNRDLRDQKDNGCTNRGPRDELNLSETQMSQLAEQKLKFGKSILPLQNELAERSAQLRTLSTGEKVSLSDINQTIDEIGNLTVSSGSPECIQSAFLEAFRCFNFVDIHGYFFENS